MTGISLQTKSGNITHALTKHPLATADIFLFNIGKSVDTLTEINHVNMLILWAPPHAQISQIEPKKAQNNPSKLNIKSVTAKTLTKRKLSVYKSSP